METLELPVLDESTLETPSATCAEEDIDLAAFALWRAACRPQPEDENE